MKLMVIDGNSIVNRAFYGVSQNLSTREGQPTNAIFGFLNILNKLLEEEKPEALCVTFDRAAPTFRHLAYAEYKANRKGMPEELAQQMPVLKEVLDAMDTKWNALGFRPGLVGGHCIGVDPYYLSAAAARAGAPSELTCLARRINEGMSSWIAQETVRELTAAGLQAASARILVLGITFKENCSDIRNSKAAELIFRLQEAGMTVAVSDSLADPAAVRRDYGLDLVSLEQAPRADCVIVAVAHDQ